MLKLRKFKDRDADTVASWLKDEYTFNLWSAGKYNRFPISGDDISDYYAKNKNLTAYVAYESGITSVNNSDELVGHFMINCENQPSKTALLGCIIINPEKRGCGYGKEMLLLAVKTIFESGEINSIRINVFGHNKSAIACYSACGFKMMTNDTVSEFLCMNEKWRLIGMELSKPEI